MNTNNWVPETLDLSKTDDASHWERYLVFGFWPLQTTLEAVDDDNWQLVRISMKGTNLQYKWATLRAYLVYNQFNTLTKIRVTNYVYALKRGGLIK